MKLIKGGGHVPKQCYCCHEDGTQSRYMVPVGLYLIRTVSEPWMMAMSRSQNRKYYFHTLEKTSSFTIPADSIANLRQCLKTRLFWRWDETVRLTNVQKVTTSADSLSLSKEHLVKFINEKLQH